MTLNKTGRKTNLLRREYEDFKVLMRNVPCAVVSLFTLSVVMMNLLANKEIHTGLPWLALDCGFTLSWLSFLSMDIITKRFGPKASIQMSFFAVCVNLLMSGLLICVKMIPGNWSAYYTYGIEEVNAALNDTFGGLWYVLMGSMIAFLLAAVVNAVLNHTIGKNIASKGFKHFAIRSWISTVIAQFVDNMVFALIVGHNFFGWSMLQVVTCSLTGCVMELLCEVVFSPYGYRVSKQWEESNVGKEYLERR